MSDMKDVINAEIEPRQTARDFELMALQIAAQKARRKEEKRRRDLVHGKTGYMMSALIEDVGRILLAADPDMDPLTLRDETKFREILHTKLCGRPWPVSVPEGARISGGFIGAMSLDADADNARFRMVTNALVHMIAEWIDEARSAQ